MSIVIPQLKVIVADAMTAATVATMSVSGEMGQTVYIEDAADSFNASQSVAVVETALKTSSVDSFAVSDSQTVLRKQHNISQYDSFSCSQSQSLLLKHLNLQVADSLSASESQSYRRGQLVINPVDSFAITDAATVSPQAAIEGRIVSVSETINASESQSYRLGQLVLNLADSLSLSDSNSNRVTPLRISSSDGISASESATVTPSTVSVLTVSTGDSFSASDSGTVIEPRLIVSPYDSFSTSDYASTGGVVSVLSVSAYDRFVQTDIPSFNWNRYNLSIYDAIYGWDEIRNGGASISLPGYTAPTSTAYPFIKIPNPPRTNNERDWEAWRQQLVTIIKNFKTVDMLPDGSSYAKTLSSSQIHKTYTWIIKNPSIGQVPGPVIDRDCIAEQLDAYVVGGTSATFNVDIRTVPGTSGVYLRAADLTATTAGVSSTLLANPNLVSGQYLFTDITAVSGGPVYLALSLRVYQSLFEL